MAHPARSGSITWRICFFGCRPRCKRLHRGAAGDEGSVPGPAVAGVVADAFGAAAMFLRLAVVPAAYAALLRARQIREDAEPAAVAARG